MPVITVAADWPHEIEVICQPAHSNLGIKWHRRRYWWKKLWQHNGLIAPLAEHYADISEFNVQIQSMPKFIRPSFHHWISSSHNCVNHINPFVFRFMSFIYSALTSIFPQWPDSSTVAGYRSGISELEVQIPFSH